MTNKMTKRDYYNVLLSIEAVASNPSLVEFIKHELALLDKKNKSKSGELAETQKENLELGADILEYMSAHRDTEFTIKKIREHYGLTAQKITPIMTALVNEHKVSKRVDKRISYYSLV